MNFHDQLIITLVDKFAIGVLLLVGGFVLNAMIERYKSQRAIEGQRDKLRDETRLAFLGRQLSEFYWPLYIRLEKDLAIWEKILDVNKEVGTPDQKVAVAIEEEVILPNHRAMNQLIEDRIYLCQPDSKLMAGLMEYVRRATEYQALRALGDTRRFATDEIGTDWLHQSLFEEIKGITATLQAKYDALVLDTRYNGA